MVYRYFVVIKANENISVTIITTLIDDDDNNNDDDDHSEDTIANKSFSVNQ